MKKLLILVFSIVALTCTSCDLMHDNQGYPHKLTLSKHGGEKVVHGSTSFWVLSISDYYGNNEDWNALYPELGPVDTLWVSNQWLTIGQPDGENKLILIAEPNTTQKKRKLYFRGELGPEYVEITIEQNK